MSPIRQVLRTDISLRFRNVIAARKADPYIHCYMAAGNVGWVREAGFVRELAETEHFSHSVLAHESLNS
jgi:hypothetical protein